MSLVSYGICRAASVWSVVMALFAAALAIAGFINMATFRNETAIGIWAGLPLFVPVLLGLVVMGTRQRSMVILYMVANVIMLGACIYSAYSTATELEDWDSFSDKVDSGQCVETGAYCSCTGAIFPDEIIVSSCSLFHFGWELFLTMTVLAAGAGLCCLIGIFISLTALIMEEDELETFRKTSLKKKNSSRLRGFNSEMKLGGHHNGSPPEANFYSMEQI